MVSECKVHDGGLRSEGTAEDSHLILQSGVRKGEYTGDHANLCNTQRFPLPPVTHLLQKGHNS